MIFHQSFPVSLEEILVWALDFSTSWLPLLELSALVSIFAWERVCVVFIDLVASRFVCLFVCEILFILLEVVLKEHSASALVSPFPGALSSALPAPSFTLMAVDVLWS